MADATSAVSPLRRRMIDDMTLCNLSPAKQRSYLHAVAKFSRYFDCSPDRLGLEDVRAFQVYLVSKGISWPALNQTVCALRFFYGVTLNRAEIPERIAYARTPRKLPTILSADEVVRFLEAVPSLKARATDNGLCRGPACLRGSQFEGHGYRQRSHADSGPPWQRRQGPDRHALAPASRHLADLLYAVRRSHV
nr:phage integrase N-terminal SAM-like domain-containing protein [Roseovarius pacificus]